MLVSCPFSGLFSPLYGLYCIVAVDWTKQTELVTVAVLMLFCNVILLNTSRDTQKIGWSKFCWVQKKGQFPSVTLWNTLCYKTTDADQSKVNPIPILFFVCMKLQFSAIFSFNHQISLLKKAQSTCFADKHLRQRNVFIVYNRLLLFLKKEFILSRVLFV